MHPVYAMAYLFTILFQYWKSIVSSLHWHFHLSTRIAKDPRFERLPCTHKGTYADDCLVERVTQVYDFQCPFHLANLMFIFFQILLDMTYLYNIKQYLWFSHCPPVDQM